MSNVKEEEKKRKGRLRERRRKEEGRGKGEGKEGGEYLLVRNNHLYPQFLTGIEIV